MKYLVLIVLVFPSSGQAQSKMAGPGPFVIGVTTPDSLNRIDFEEGDQSYVKGTLTLPCTHIRTFTSGKVDMAGIVITNLTLAFYDNQLFTLSCDYSDTLKAAFLIHYGKGIPQPEIRVPLCTRRTDKPLVLWGDVWQNDDILALVVHAKGYTSDCQPVARDRLTIASQRLSALASDCEVKTTDPFVEEFQKELNVNRQQQKQPANGRTKKQKRMIGNDG